MPDSTVLAWSWNAPRRAINPSNAEEPAIEYLTPKGERKALAYSDLVDVVYRVPLRPRDGEARRAFDRARLARHLRRRVQALPAFIRKRFSMHLETLDRRDRKEAVRWLFNTFERHVLRRVDAVNAQYLPQSNLPAILFPLRDDFHLLPWADKKRLKRLAYRLANLMKSEFMREFDFRYEKTADVEFSTIYAYGAIASKASSLNIAIPGWKQYCDEALTAEDALRVIARLQTEKWWLGKLRKIHDRWREHLLIATSYVSKVASPYCSEPCLREWVAQKKANFEYLQAMELEDQDTGERTSLLDKVMGSVSNPKIARHELMVRMRGFEDMANEMGLVGMFYTLTAPSRYHATHVHSGKRNDKYCNASPRKTQKYLCNVWSRVRAKWGREGIRTFGFRVAEPHHDGTPHWHLLLFLRPEEVELATEIFHEYALQVDGSEPGAAQYRFTAKPIDEEFGSATGYIAKYISKNIDGYGMDGEFDHESGKPVKEMAKRVRAWASRWSIRQFQQIGGAPVSTWRELRRLGSRELVLHPELDAARAAADAPDWPGYVNAQGGPFVTRDCLRVRLNYEYTENGNDYGDTVAKISGVYCPFTISESVIYTRTNDYKIVPKRKPSPVENLTLEGRGAAPWTRVNNCTENRKCTDLLVEREQKDEPEQYEIGQMTLEEKRNLNECLRNYKPKRQKSPADEFEALANAITSSDCDEIEQTRAENYLKVAHELRQQESLISVAPTSASTPDGRIDVLGEYARSIGIELSVGQIKKLISRESLRIDGKIVYATNNRELRHREDTSIDRKITRLWQHMQLQHGVDICNIRYDPKGYYAAMLKKIDPVAWSRLFGIEN